MAEKLIHRLHRCDKNLRNLWISIYNPRHESTRIGLEFDSGFHAGRVLAAYDGTLRLEPRWLKADFYFRPNGGDKNSYFKAGDLLREDGRYSVRLTVDNKLYGEYPFVVKGNHIELQGKQIREKTEPMVQIVDYLSGGRYTSWWIQRQ